jgi:hypothetical protein
MIFWHSSHCRGDGESPQVQGSECTTLLQAALQIAVRAAGVRMWMNTMSPARLAL